ACSRARPPRALHSFPTRRSSDLLERMGGLLKRMPATAAIFLCGAAAAAAVPGLAGFASEFVVYRGLFDALGRLPPAGQAASAARSEEHTSELQSPCNIVCRLLLE